MKSLILQVLPDPQRLECRWGLTEQQGRYRHDANCPKDDAIGALEASLRGVEDCAPWCIHFASPRYGWDQGTAPIDLDEEGGGNPYQWVQEGHGLWPKHDEPKYSYPWLSEHTPPGLSVTYCELMQAWLADPLKAVHALVRLGSLGWCTAHCGCFQVYVRSNKFLEQVPREHISMFVTDASSASKLDQFHVKLLEEMCVQHQWIGWVCSTSDSMLSQVATDTSTQVYTN